MVGVVSPEVSMVTPRFSAKGRSVSVASSAMRDRSTCSRVKDRWSARLSRSSASVRSIARVLTAWRRSTSSPLSRFGSLRATSRSVCVIASGVRSSWEALAANLCCSATCASSRASRPSKVSARSGSSSLRPREREALVQVALGDLPRRRRDRAQRAQDPAGDEPAERDRDRGHDRQRDPGLDEPLVETVGLRARTPTYIRRTWRSDRIAQDGSEPGPVDPCESRSGR